MSEVKRFEHLLDDVMEIIDIPELKCKLVEVEREYISDSGELNTARFGIILHEAALNLAFLSNEAHRGYSGESFRILDSLAKSGNASAGLMPFVESYRASSLSLLSVETKRLGLIGKAFAMLDGAVAKY